MKNSVENDTMYLHSVHGVIVMKKNVADNTIAPTQHHSSESRFNQERNDSLGSKLKLLVA